MFYGHNNENESIKIFTFYIMKLYIVLLLHVLSLHIYAQEENAMFDIETRGAINSNRPLDDSEYFGQYRTVLVGLSIGKYSKLQTGISVARVENNEVIEIPLFYRFQVMKSLSAYAGSQIQFIRGFDSSFYRESSATMGVDYQFKSNWDAGIQFLVPFDKNSDAPQDNFNFLQPIRLRTGIKF